MLTVRRHSRLPLAIESLASTDAWDALRTSELETSFTIPSTRDRWLARCEAEPRLARRAAAVAELADEVGADSITSYGVGTGVLEYHLHRARPALTLIVSDAAPASVQRLRGVFPEAEHAGAIDLLRDPLEVRPRTLVLLHRIDTEFSDLAWPTVFSRLAAAQTEHVLVIPSEFLGVRNGAIELARRVRSFVSRRSETFCGYLRPRRTFLRAWSEWYEIARETRCDDVSLLLLRRKETSS